MKKLYVVLLLSVFSFNAHSEDSKHNLPTALIGALEKQFPNSKVFAYSPECKSDPNGALQFGVVVGQISNLHAIIAITVNHDWMIYDLPKRVEYRGGAMSDFLDDYTTDEAAKALEVRCTNPQKDSDISTEANGAFIKHRGENASTNHLCFTASKVYNSWVCYWTKPQTQKPELSFVQFNAD